MEKVVDGNYTIWTHRSFTFVKADLTKCRSFLIFKSKLEKQIEQVYLRSEKKNILKLSNWVLDKAGVAKVLAKWNKIVLIQKSSADQNHSWQL